MQSLFSVRWISFYGTTIAIVIALFSAATSYGEANLKAPPKIAGRYRIDPKKLPGCLQSKTVVLAIEQSGVYLNGSLLEADASTRTATAARKKPSMIGKLERDEITLSGNLDHLQNCEPQDLSVEIRGKVAKNVLQGELKIGEERSQFVAQREETSEQGEKK